MESSSSASVHLYSNQFPFVIFVFKSVPVCNILDYLTIIVCPKVEDVIVENHRDYSKKTFKIRD